MSTKHFEVCLFGGAGYLGTHLAHAMAGVGKSVLVLDPQVPVVKVRRVHYAAHVQTNWTATQFWLLACPRNKPDTWDFKRAENMLDRGLGASYTLQSIQSVYVSSMSVYDTPDNEYAKFKRMAERVVHAGGWSVVRLPTLLGARRGLVYRGDLGLHQAARCLAGGGQPSLSANVRAVWPIANVVADLLTTFTPGRTVSYWNAARGTAEYHSIYPKAVRNTTADGYSFNGNAVMALSDLRRCQKAFLDLAKYIAAGKVTAI